MPYFTLNSHTSCWLEVHTQIPQCTYFFGPFSSAYEAQQHQDGYLEDLAQEGAQGIRVRVQKGNPRDLTIAP